MDSSWLASNVENSAIFRGTLKIYLQSVNVTKKLSVLGSSTVFSVFSIVYYNFTRRYFKTHGIIKGDSQKRKIIEVAKIII